jgi:hypothetical protein
MTTGSRSRSAALPKPKKKLLTEMLSIVLAFIDDMTSRALPLLPVISTIRFLRCVALAILTACVFSNSASAYSLTGKTWPNGSNIVMQMSLGNSPLPLLDGSGTSRNNAAAPALDMWNQHMGRVQFGRVMNSTAASASGDRVNSVFFSNTVFGQSFGLGTLAVTYYHMSGNNLLEADVVFNTAPAFDSYRGPLRFGANGYAIGDLRRVFLHELGHALGFNHSNADSIMSASMSDREVLSSDDIAGVQAMYGPPVAPPPAPAPIPSRAKGDFNGDNHADFVWQNGQTGERVIWFLRNGVYQTGTHLPTISPEWQIASAADFNADGHADLVWQNSQNGQRAIWFLWNGVRTSELHFGPVPLEWQIASAADFNGDGHSDLVWQNLRTGQRDIWFMRNGALLTAAMVANVPTEWRIAGATDFNADGFADLAWQNVRTGERVMWFLRDAQYQSGIYLPTVGTEWQIAAAGDYNDDGHGDLAWQNTITGERVMWFLRNGSYQSGIFLPTIPREWSICVH